MVSNSDARRRLDFGQTDLLRYVLSWLGLGLTCQEISISREWKSGTR